MPNPKLETYKSKKTGVIYDYTDADAQSKIPSGASPSNKLATASDVASRVDWSSYAKTGVHQMLPLTVDYIKALNSSRTWNGNSCTHNGVTFTINTDSKGRVISITRSGTATGFAFLRISGLSSFSGDFILNGGKDVSNTVYIQNETTSTQIAVSTGNDASITLSPTADIINCIIGTNQGTSDEQTFYPLLRLASDSNTDPGPYAMTNGELTKAVEYSTSAFTDIVSGATADQNSLLKVGRIVVARIFLTGVTANAWTALANIPEGYRPVSFVRSVNLSKNTTYLEANSGIIQCSGALSNENAQAYMTWITA